MPMASPPTRERTSTRHRVPRRRGMTLLSVTAPALLALAGAGCEAECIGEDCAEDPTPAPAAVSRLGASGTEIVNDAGDAVLLRGVALGGWNFHENWITSVDYPAHARLVTLGDEGDYGAEVRAAVTEVGPNEDADAAWLVSVEAALEARIGGDAAAALLAELALHPSVVDDSDLALRLLLERRFGVEARDEVLDRFQSAWIQEADVAWMAAQGWNVLRIPLGYRGLTSMSDEAAPTQLVWNERAWAQIDRVLTDLERHGMWAVLDIQECPGGQNEYAGPSTLYESASMQDLCVELWTEISRRFASRDAVAAYSLLAEPMSAPSSAARDELYGRILEAIRNQGDDHLAVIHDGFLGMHGMPSPAAAGWTNVVYSTHLFEWDNASLEDYEIMLPLWDQSIGAAQDDQGVPYYIGSFSTVHGQQWAYDSADLMARYFEEEGWSWTLWTWKRIDDPIDVELWGEATGWGVRGRLQGSFERPDLHRDDLETLLTKMDAYATIEVAPNEGLLSAIRR